MDGGAPAAQVGFVDDVVVDERRRVDELHHGPIQDGLVAFVFRQARGHQEQGRTQPLAAARLDVAAHLRNQLDARLDVTDEFTFDTFEIVPNWFEDLG